jgi:hypothetical protein
MSVRLLALADDLAVEQVERGKQRGCAVALGLVRDGLCASLFQSSEPVCNFGVRYAGYARRWAARRKLSPMADAMGRDGSAADRPSPRRNRKQALKDMPFNIFARGMR